jgi:hypothetical protein
VKRKRVIFNIVMIIKSFDRLRILSRAKSRDKRTEDVAVV